MSEIRTVLGNITEEQVGVTLPHEHILCFSQYLYEMAGAAYLDKEKVYACAVELLGQLRERYGLATFVDCTPINIGRDIPLLKRVSAATGVHIVCATGFYYTHEPLLVRPTEEDLCRFMVADAANVNAGLLKCAAADTAEFTAKLLRATALAQRETGLPLVVHTEAKIKNALWALDHILSQGVEPRAVTVSHLSDTDDVDFVIQVAKRGCYIGLDRHYAKKPAGYDEEKVRIICELCQAGYADRLLLSHDALFYSGFSSEMGSVNREPRYHYIFERILPHFPAELQKTFIVDNPRRMLKCE